MLDEQFSLLKQGDNLRFCEGAGDLEAQGTGWFVNLNAKPPTPRAMVMVTTVESLGSLSTVKVGSVIPVSACEIELVA